jgi:hypothetical protein
MSAANAAQICRFRLDFNIFKKPLKDATFEPASREVATRIVAEGCYEIVDQKVR